MSRRESTVWSVAARLVCGAALVADMVVLVREPSPGRWALTIIVLVILMCVCTIGGMASSAAKFRDDLDEASKMYKLDVAHSVAAMRRTMDQAVEHATDVEKARHTEELAKVIEHYERKLAAARRMP